MIPERYTLSDNYKEEILEESSCELIYDSWAEIYFYDPLSYVKTMGLSEEEEKIELEKIEKRINPYK